MNDKRHSKDQEPGLFREALSDVAPLRQDRAVLPRKRPAPVPEQSLRDAREVMDNLLSGDHDFAEIETGEELVFIRPGVRPTIARKLRRGQYAIEAELDLHGLRVPEAHELLKAFLTECRSHGKRCLRIIHGKGLGSYAKLPILKGKVNLWLRRHGDVLAFCSARPDDGGTGAIYVLLRRR